MRRTVRHAMIATGWVCVAIGAVGVVLPGLPGTPFLILAAWLFTRSSPRFERWLLNHPRLGPAVVGWRQRGAIPRRAKAFALGSMALSWGLVWLTAPPLGIALSGLAIAASALYVGTRPSS